MARSTFECSMEHASVSVLANSQKEVSERQLANDEPHFQPSTLEGHDGQQANFAEQRNSAHLGELLSGIGTWATTEPSSSAMVGPDVLSLCPNESKLVPNVTQTSEASGGLDQPLYQQCLSQLSDLTLR